MGASWEGYVVEQTIATLQAHGAMFEAHCFRTSDGYELDLVLDLAGERWAIEIKPTSSPSAADMERLDKTADMIGASRQLLVSQTGKPSGTENRASVNLPDLLDRLSRSGAHR